MQTLTASHMIFGGYSVCRTTTGEVVLVTGVIPGETFTAHIFKRKGVRFGTPEKIISAAASRVEPSAHPGLDYSHIDYEHQLKFKQDVFNDAIRGVREHFPDDIEITPSPDIWNYRNTIQPAVERKHGLGYRSVGSHDITLLDADPVAFPHLNNAWAIVASHVSQLSGVHEVVFRGNRNGETLAALIATKPANEYKQLAHTLHDAGIAGVSYAQFDERGRFRGGSERLAGARNITETYGNIHIQLNAHAFTQVNPGAAELLYQRVRELVPSGNRALEFYAGTGIISMQVADKFAHIDAFEIDRSATSRGTRAAKEAGIHNLTFHTGDVARFANSFPDADVIIVDPPRAGLTAPVRKAIQSSPAHTLVYVSCDPATFARDAKEFVANGWKVKHAELFDFFPHTHHVESVVVLNRAGAPDRAVTS